MTIDQWFIQQDKSVERTYQRMRKSRRKTQAGKSSLELLIDMKENRERADCVIAACQQLLIDKYLDGGLDTSGHAVEVRQRLGGDKPVEYLVVDGRPILIPGL